MKQMDGVAIGLVSEIDAKLGRVKVKFPWMDPPQKSHWAPIASFLSGKKRGGRFMPELEDEALIAFDRGKFDHPYVVGFLWNGEDESPDDVKTNRVVVTPGGHELRFEDKEGDRRIVVKTADGHNLTFDDKDKLIRLKSKDGHYLEMLDQDKSVTLQSKNGHKFEILDTDGKVIVSTQSGGKITLDNQPGKAVIEASTNVITLGPDGITVDCKAGTLNIKSMAETKIEATGAMTVKSSATMNVETTGAMTVKSTAVMNVEATGAMTIKSTAAMTIQSSAAMTVTASGAVTLTAGVLSVSAGMASFSGVLQCSTMIATSVIATSVVSSTYTPGAGNML